jgi:spore coat polysaccharide biosynthesis protein SpsF
MKTVAIIQARMGSSRLPGKVMLPLDGKHVLERDIERVSRADTIDEVVVATSDLKCDDIIERYAERSGATVFRGSESDVLGRMYGAATETGADVVVRITGDCPLISPTCIDTTVRRQHESGVDYASNTIEETLPRGLDVEVFTYETFSHVNQNATAPEEREHVTLYYRRYQEQFEIENVAAPEIFETSRLQERTELRLTLDEADDYELLRRVYEGLNPSGHLSIEKAIAYIDEHELAEINRNVAQKSPAQSETSGDPSS